MISTLQVAAYSILFSGLAVIIQGAKVRFRSGFATYPRTRGGSGSGSDNIGLILGIFFGSLGGIILFTVLCVCLTKCWAKRRNTLSNVPTFTGQDVHVTAPHFSDTQAQAKTVWNSMTDQTIKPFQPAPADGLLPANDPVWSGQTGHPYPVSPFISTPPFREPEVSSPHLQSEPYSVSYASEKGVASQV